eukprot:3722525-Rhodomonas_salina.1
MSSASAPDTQREVLTVFRRTPLDQLMDSLAASRVSTQSQEEATTAERLDVERQPQSVWTFQETSLLKTNVKASMKNDSIAFLESLSEDAEIGCTQSDLRTQQHAIAGMSGMACSREQMCTNKATQGQGSSCNPPRPSKPTLVRGTLYYTAVHHVDQIICEGCRRDDQEEKMLLCDGCNKGFHFDCLNPPLAGIPEGDWMCAPCTFLIDLIDTPKPRAKKSKLAKASHPTHPRRE